MAKDIKVTFKKDEEDIYEYILLKGKGLYLKELIRKDLEMNSDSLKTTSVGSNVNLDNDTRKLLISILENTQDIKNKLIDNIGNNKVNKPDNEISDTDKLGAIESEEKCKIIRDFSIDDLP